MRLLLFLTAFFFGQISTYASVDYFVDFNREACSGMRQISSTQAVCWGPTNSKEVQAARKLGGNEVTFKEIQKQFRGHVQIWGIVELGIWPDDSTREIYEFYYLLRNSKKEVIGYLTITGYENSEMEQKIQITQRYTKLGKLVSVSVQERN